ncbi:MAG: YdcF family protein [Gammaproteobacteria bacterium]|nr:YdcF family protein [Gammaproteobacteria bacterium]
MDGFLLSKFVAAWLLPPGGLIIGLVLGLALRRTWRRAGNLLIGLSLAALVALTSPPVAHLLMSGLDRYPPLTTGALKDHRPEVIVVLSGDRREEAAEYGGDTVGTATLERLRYGIRLNRATGLPLLLSGGSVSGDDDFSLAFLMKEAAVDDFRVPVVWLEEESRNTWENAVYSAAVLEHEGISRILLVTHAYHMPRSMACFEAAGMEPRAAPTGLIGPLDMKATDWIPSSKALVASTLALHEYLGMVWYRIKYDL